MAKLLVTSGQIQVAASGLIIIFCTFALFISGYVIQQRTLGQLRVAIQPRGIPAGAQPQRVTTSAYAHAYLPERFRESTTKLEDGTIVVIESEAEQEAKQQSQRAEDKAKPEAQGSQKVMKKADVDMDVEVNQDAKKENIDIVEALKAKVKEKMVQEKAEEKAKEKKKSAGRPDLGTKNSKPLTAAQRRKMIKQDLRRTGQAEDPAYYQRRMW